MHQRTTARHAAGAARKSMEIGIAAPQVIAHRLTRMALAGPRPSERDLREFTGMWLEKPAAFGQAFLAAWLQFVRHQWSFGASLWPAMFAITNAAIAPVHSKAVANARRLARTRLTARR